MGWRLGGWVVFLSRVFEACSLSLFLELHEGSLHRVSTKDDFPDARLRTGLVRCLYSDDYDSMELAWFTFSFVALLNLYLSRDRAACIVL